MVNEVMSQLGVVKFEASMHSVEYPDACVLVSTAGC